MQELCREYRPALLHLLDNAISPALLAQFARTPPGAPWYGFARVTPELQDPDFCRALRQSGCVMLQLGLESGSDRVLAEMNKGITSAEASRALRCLHAAGIATYVYLLFGTPWETEARSADDPGFHRDARGPLLIFSISRFSICPLFRTTILRMLCERFPTLICRCILILCIPQAGTEKACAHFWISGLNATMRLLRSSSANRRCSVQIMRRF